MKRLFKGVCAFVLLGLMVFPWLPPKEAQGHEMAYRTFFQTTSTYPDGAKTRWTGCVNLGGSCWSEESVVADCSFDGGETWQNCNSNPGLAGTGG